MTQTAVHTFTKIVATMGPACADVPTLVRLIEEGVRVFRLNFSHGDFDRFAQMVQTLRQAAEQAGEPVGILGDLPGPKIRLGQVIDGGIELNTGDRFIIQKEAVITGSPSVPIPVIDDAPIKAVFSSTYAGLVHDVQVGHRLLINDGEVRSLVIEKIDQADQAYLICQVTDGGPVTSAKGINLPDTELTFPSLTRRDVQCADWAVEHGLDFLAMSFVRRAEDLRQLRLHLQETLGLTTKAVMPQIIAKIEKPQAIDDLQAILQQADGVMVARGDLGVEMDLAQVPIIQKKVIAMAHDFGKPVIVATQMLQSMIEHPGPTRAEVSDVANAIFDGADAVMLSGETAVGKYPLPTVHMMANIARQTEQAIAQDQRFRGRAPTHLVQTRYRTAALAHAASVLIQDLDARLVITWSELGGGARYLSQNRLGVPIIAASSNPASLRRMNLLFGVRPVYMERPKNAEYFLHEIDKLICKQGWAKPGDPVVMAKGEPLGTPGVMNQLVIHYLGDTTRVRWHTSPPSHPKKEPLLGPITNAPPPVSP